MKKENLKIVIHSVLEENVPFSPRQLYNKQKLKISYKTFLRGVIKLMVSRNLQGYKVSHGRGRGINWIITSKNEEGLKLAIR